MKNVDAGVSFSGNEPIGDEMGIDSLIPCIGCLFETIETFKQVADVVRMVVGDKSFGLHNVDLFGEMCMEEGGINIHLVDFQIEGSGEGQ